MAAARRAQGLLKDSGDHLGQARALQVIASVQFNKGYWELCLRAARDAQRSLAQCAADTGGEDVARLVREVETLAAHAHHARGEEPPQSERRAAALQAVQELGQALEARDATKFQQVLARLKETGCYTGTDTSRVFAPALEEDEDSVSSFLFEHMRWHFDEGVPPGVLQSSEYWGPADVCCLRTFPSPLALQSGSGVGPAQGLLTWQQSCGQLTMRFRLMDGPRTQVPGGWAEEDVVVQLADRRLKLTLGGDPVKAMTGDLWGEIWRKDSWWAIEEEDEQAVLVITLLKRELRTWAQPWTTIGSTASRAPFPWNKSMREYGDNNNRSGILGTLPPQDLVDESELEAVAPGRPEPEEDEAVPNGGYARTLPGDVFSPPSERFICRPEDLCLGITADQDSNSITIQVHFERSAFYELRQRHPLEKVFAVDVWENALCIFLQGDKQNPIVWGELNGPCLPYHTTWRLSSSESMRRRQDDNTLVSPSLEVRIRKAPGARGPWPQIFGQCVQARLMAKPWEQGAPRFEGLPDVATARRAGYDLEDPDFWSLVNGYCHETIKKTGHSTAPRKLVSA